MIFQKHRQSMGQKIRELILKEKDKIVLLNKRKNMAEFETEQDYFHAHIAVPYFYVLGHLVKLPAYLMFSELIICLFTVGQLQSNRLYILFQRPVSGRSFFILSHDDIILFFHCYHQETNTALYFTTVVLNYNLHSQFYNSK